MAICEALSQGGCVCFVTYFVNSLRSQRRKMLQAVNSDFKQNCTLTGFGNDLTIYYNILVVWLQSILPVEVVNPIKPIEST